MTDFDNDPGLAVSFSRGRAAETTPAVTLIRPFDWQNECNAALLRLYDSEDRAVTMAARLSQAIWDLNVARQSGAALTDELNRRAKESGVLRSRLADLEAENEKLLVFVEALEKDPAAGRIVQSHRRLIDKLTAQRNSAVVFLVGFALIIAGLISRLVRVGM